MGRIFESIKERERHHGKNDGRLFSVNKRFSIDVLECSGLIGWSWKINLGKNCQ